MSIENQNVIVRSNLSGVIVGKLLHVNMSEGWVQLEKAVRLWKWKAAKGVSLQGLSLFGIVQEQSIVEPRVSWMLVRDVVDITPMSDSAMSTIPIL